MALSQSDGQDLGVQRAMQLQPEQERQLLEAHAALVAADRQLAADRELLVASLQTVQPATACQAQSLFSAVQVCLRVSHLLSANRSASAEAMAILNEYKQLLVGLPHERMTILV